MKDNEENEDNKLIGNLRYKEIKKIRQIMETYQQGDKAKDIPSKELKKAIKKCNIDGLSDRKIDSLII